MTLRSPGARCLPALWLLLWLLLSGCALFSERRSLELILPQPPAEWAPFAGRLTYEVFWIAEGGRTTGVTVREGQLLKVDLLKLGGSAVTVTPLLSTDRGTRRLLPAGAIYPRDLIEEEGRIGALWWRGFEAVVFQELARRSFDYSAVNRQRFEEELRSRCSDNPWEADRRMVLERLLEGSFRASYLAPRQRETTMREVPPGRYLTENALEPVVETRLVEGRSNLVLEVLPGSHRYFHEAGDVELLVTWDGQRPPQWAFFGRWK